MKKQQIKRNPPNYVHPLDKRDNLMMKKAFTLVELIIVITILAVLATIAFVSFSNHTALSRDTKRIVTIESISKWLNIFHTYTGKYPNVDNQSSTGIINSDTLSFVWEVGDNVSKLINISPTPKDPVSGNNFKYATSFDNKYFQVAGTQEKPVAEKSIINQSYANSRQAKVLGNYNWLLKKENKLYNLPSLIYTWSGNLLSNTTYFVIDKWQNLPYKITATDLDNSVQTSVILSQLTGTSSVVLTWVTISPNPTEFKNNIWTIVQILLYTEEKVWAEAFWSDYFLNKTQSWSSFVSWSWWSFNYLWLCWSNWQIIYTDDLGVEIWRVTNTWATISWNPWLLNINWHIIVCSWVSTWFILKSVNEGASTTDILSLNSFWKLFQWWNNWWWNEWSVTTSSRQVCTNWSTTNVTTFVSWNDDWCTISNNDVWWWVSASVADDRWPCPDWYSVPSAQTWNSIYTAWWWSSLSSQRWLHFSRSLKIPFWWYRNYGDTLESQQGVLWYYWSNTQWFTSTQAFTLYMSNSSVTPAQSQARANWFSVRCIKN